MESYSFYPFLSGVLRQTSLHLHCVYVSRFNMSLTVYYAVLVLSCFLLCMFPFFNLYVWPYILVQMYFITLFILLAKTHILKLSLTKLLLNKTCMSSQDPPSPPPPPPPQKKKKLLKNFVIQPGFIILYIC